MRLAVATDDGEHFMGRHFGDAKFFEIYEFSGSGYEVVGQGLRPEHQAHQEALRLRFDRPRKNL